jgi:PTS system nitrogen regulatory IIA component
MQLTVRQAARILAVPEQSIYQWLDAGEIPVHRVNDQFRFNRGELLEWATARGIPVSVEHFSDDANGNGAASLVEALAAGGIHRKVGGDDRASVLRAVVGLMPIADETEREFLFQLLVAREAMGSTAVGGGIAIPHARNPVVLHLSRPAITLCFLASGIEFAALDRKPVDTLFTLVTPSIRTHLHLLARLSSALHDPAFKAAVLARASDERILAEARRVEAGFAPPPNGA